MTLVHNTTTPDIETSGPEYRRRFAGPVGAYFLGMQERSIMDLLATLPGKRPFRILEVGGGHCQITGALLQTGHEVTVQGSSAACFEQLQEVSRSAGAVPNTIASSLWSIPVPDRSFDVVIALRLLAHVELWRELLAEMGRISRQAIIVDFAAKSALNALTPVLFGVKRKIEGNTRLYFSYSRRELSSELSTLGFPNQSSARQFFFPMGMHRALKRPVLSRCAEGTARSLGLTSLFGSPVILCAARPPVSPESRL